MKESKGNGREKTTVTEMKNAFDGLISRLDMAEESISELEVMSIGTYQTEIQTGKRIKKME